jgi:hypothetical protein
MNLCPADLTGANLTEANLSDTDLCSANLAGANLMNADLRSARLQFAILHGAAGTYYLVGNVPGYSGTTVTPGDVDGWVLSTGIYDDAAGTVTNGLGSFVGTTWTENTSNPTPAFTVNGSASSSVPEPSTFALLGTGIVLLGFRRLRNKQQRAR